VTTYSLCRRYQRLVEHAASIFRVEVCMVRNQLRYLVTQTLVGGRANGCRPGLKGKLKRKMPEDTVVLSKFFFFLFNYTSTASKNVSDSTPSFSVCIRMTSGCLEAAFHLLTGVTMKIDIFWDITPCSPVKVNRRFRGTPNLHLQSKLSKKPA
jgi:hypothetical protein